MNFSKRVMSVSPSETLTLNAKAIELRKRGLAIINLLLGEPDAPTPPHICQAAKQAVDDGHFGYTAVEGIAELREAVGGYYRTIYGVPAGMDNVIITNGGKQSLYNLFQALLNEGDEVLIPAPYWTSYPDMVRLAGGVPVFVQALSGAGYRLSAEMLELAYTPKCRLLILNSPSNPTGVTYNAEEMDAFANWALTRDVFVISDEIYDQLVYPPAKAASLAKYWQAHPEHFAIVNGLSKSFAMTGWRVGHTLAHPALIAELGKIQSQATSNINAIAQYAALRALRDPYDCIDEMRSAFMRRRDMVLSRLAQWPDVVCPAPEGAFYIFPDVSACYSHSMPGSVQLCAYLLERAQVGVMPGKAFGNDNCIRISYAASDEQLDEALTRMGKALFAG